MMRLPNIILWRELAFMEDQLSTYAIIWNY